MITGDDILMLLIFISILFLTHKIETFLAQSATVEPAVLLNFVPYTSPIKVCFCYICYTCTFSQKVCFCNTLCLLRIKSVFLVQTATLEPFSKGCI